MPPGEATSEPGSQAQDYNAVLEFYLEEGAEELDLVGLVAYGLYKRQKRDWIIRYRSMHGGARPDEAGIDAITNHYLTDDVRRTLRDRATDLLTSYAETYVDAVEPQIRVEALSNETLRQAQAIERKMLSDSKFWPQVWTGLIATGIWTAFVTVVVGAAVVFGSDFVDAWSSLTSALR